MGINGINNYYLKIGQGSQGVEQRHGLSRARGSAQHEWLVFSQPGIEESLVPHGVQRGNNNVRRPHLVGLNLNLGDLAHPLRPLSLDGHLEGWESEMNSTEDNHSEKQPQAHKIMSDIILVH